MYIRYRADLVALAFVISLVSALPLPKPIPALQSELSSSTLFSHDANDNMQVDNRKILSMGQMSRAPAAMRALTRRNVRYDDLIDGDDDQLVRRTSIFTKIKEGFQKFGQDVKHGFQKFGQDIKHVAQKVGDGIKKVAEKVGTGIKNAAEKVGTGIKKVAEKIGTGVKTAAKKVWHFVKTTGATIAKFGLKVVQSVGEVVAKVASFIPEVGKPIEKAIDGISKVAGVVSDHIHAKLSTALQKGMKVMNKADKIMSYF